MSLQKTLIASTVLLASGAAFAQSSVTLYGIADINLSSSKNGGVRETNLNSSGIYESRFGLKGSKDLGAGLKVNFQLEQGFALDTGTTSIGQAFSRQSWVGVSGAFGEVRVGKTWSAYDDISGRAQAAKNSMFAPNRGVWLTGSHEDNPNNGLYYASPNFGGWSFAVSYGLGENKTAAVGAGSIISAHLKYANGPIFVGIAQQNEKATGASESINFTRINGTYDLGLAKLLASYGRVSSGNKSTREWQLGADVPLTPALTLSGGVARSSGGITGFTGDAGSYIGRTADVTAPGAADVERTGFGIAAFFTLSEHTMLYGGYRASTTRTPGAADVDSSVIAVGVVHKF